MTVRKKIEIESTHISVIRIIVFIGRIHTSINYIRCYISANGLDVTKRKKNILPVYIIVSVRKNRQIHYKCGLF